MAECSGITFKGEIFAFFNFLESFNCALVCFEEKLFLEILRSPLSTGVAGLQTTKNELQTKFFKGALKLTEHLQEMISIGLPLE